ncbi:1-deoxy-D-xylulose-5-phosphate synthase [bacterium]|nr:1-deoxy-D-xylulose-5-phosphate synthase [bacterium]
MKILDKLNSLDDLKNFTYEELKSLASEMRSLIIKKVNTTGGHLAPNLGFIEPTIALHKVFNSPVDKFVFDVSHQCYPHKILTGRKKYYENPEKYLEISGYTNPEESAHDTFVIGHTSTSVSLACGIAKARDLRGEKYNVVAIIGDGSLSGGEAYEGLNNGTTLGSNFIVIVNDNEMSIAENQGGLYENLRLLRETNGQAECNFFKSLGYDYYYVSDGNDLSQMIEVLEKVKGTEQPTVVHIRTQKGKGLKAAEDNKELFHWIVPNLLDENNEIANTQGAECPETYASVTIDFLLNKCKQDKTVFAINPATPGAVGFTPDIREKFGANFVDTGIAEEHAVAYASASAKNGANPYLLLISSFLQRTYDQLSQDLALNNSPMTILVYWGAIQANDMTHLGCFDIPIISNIPNIVYLAPATKEEYLKMLEFSYLNKEFPLAIRVPFTNIISTGEVDNTDYSILNKFKVTQSGSEVALIGVGNFYHLALEVAQNLENEGIKATVINPRFISGLDKELLNSLKENHKLVVTLEDGVLDGGFGQKVASFYGNSDIKVLNYGAEKEFPDRVSIAKLYEKYRLKKELIVSDIKEIL